MDEEKEDLQYCELILDAHTSIWRRADQVPRPLLVLTSYSADPGRDRTSLITELS